MSIANQEMIRDNNRRLVLEYLVNHPPDFQGRTGETTESYQGYYLQYCSGSPAAKFGSGNRQRQNCHGKKAYSSGISKKLRIRSGY